MTDHHLAMKKYFVGLGSLSSWAKYTGIYFNFNLNWALVYIGRYIRLYRDRGRGRGIKEAGGSEFLKIPKRFTWGPKPRPPPGDSACRETIRMK